MQVSKSRKRRKNCIFLNTIFLYFLLSLVKQLFDLLRDPMHYGDKYQLLTALLQVCAEELMTGETHHGGHGKDK